MLQAYRFALDPNPAQARLLASHCGAARKAFNEALARVRRCLDQRDAERSYGVPDDLLTEVPWTLPALRRWWNLHKDELAPLLQAAGRRRWYCSFTVGTGREPARPAHVGVDRAHPVVGVDVGVRDLLVAAAPYGTQVARVPAPRSLAAAQARLRAAQRRSARQDGPDWRIGRHGSKRWRRTARRVARIHARVADLRRDALHQATTRLARRHQVIVIEDLAVKNMTRRKPGAGKGGRGLNRALADAAPAEVRRQLGYKTSWYGSHLIVADRWYPSSKTCSACGGRKPSLTLAERTWTCHGCGAMHDRDLDAAVNLARPGEHATGVEARPAGSGPVAGRGASQKTPPGGAGGKETSTPQDQPIHKTGTAPPQGEAA